MNVDLTVSADPALLEGMEALRLLAEAEQEAEIKRLTDMRALVAKLARKRDESIKAKREDHGVRNYRYAQTFRGIPVFGEDVVVSEDSAGNVRTLFGNLVSGLEQDVVSVTPRLRKGNARYDAIQFNFGHPPGNRTRVAYRLAINEYMGVESPQLMVEYLDQ